MKLFATVHGSGFFGGLFHRPSTWMLVAAGALYLLQLFPPTGIVLMMFGASQLTGTLLLLAVPTFFAEAVLGFVPRILAVIPVALTVGYYGAMASELARLPNVEAQLNLGEPVAVLVFDPARHVVRDVSLDLLAAYQLPSIYGPIGGKSRTIGETRTCEMISYSGSKKNKPGVPLGVSTDVLGKTFCVSWRDVPVPKTGLISFDSRSSSENIDGLKVNLTTEVVSLDGTEVGGHAMASAEVLKPFPTLALGCGLLSSQPAWLCFGAFQRDRVDLGSHSATSSQNKSLIEQRKLARAKLVADRAKLIGLAPRTPDQIEALTRIP